MNRTPAPETDNRSREPLSGYLVDSQEQIHRQMREPRMLRAMAPPTEQLVPAQTLLSLDRAKVRPVKDLLSGLPRDYPGALSWLDRRLRDSLEGTAECWLVATGTELVGALILTPKPSALKLSTIYVADRFRGCGIGSMLMDRAITSAVSLGMKETYVTVAEHTVPLLRPLLDSRGFTYTALERHRYGLNRHEAIYSRLEP